MTLEEMGPLRESLERHGLSAKKSFGQHFLLDLNVTRKIARAAEPLTGRVVVEVGPGPGGLTRALLETDATHVVAIEKDQRFRPVLEELCDAAAGRLTVVLADALAADEQALAQAHAPRLPLKVVANLPYNVGTPLLVKWLTAEQPPEAMILMFQKEVARRIVAAPGSDAYGRLAVLSQALAECRILFELPARAFTPPPKVESAVVSLTPLPVRPAASLVRSLERVTAAAFGQRRKMLRSSLKSVGGEALLAAAGIDASKRAEELAVDAFLELAAHALTHPEECRPQAG